MFNCLFILFRIYIILAVMRLKYDRIGSWSIIKLEIVEKYAKPLTKEFSVGILIVYH